MSTFKYSWKRQMSAKVVKKLLKERGFLLKRMGKGSHEIWEKAGRAVTIPNHGSKSIPTGTLNSIRKAVEKILDAE